MSQTPINTGPTEEAFAALLIIATLGFGSLYIVAKTAGNRFGGSPLQNEREINADEVYEKPDTSTDQEQHCFRCGGDSTHIVQNDRSQMEVNQENEKIPSIQTKVQAPQPPRDHNRHEGLNAIRAWEIATTDRIQRQKAKKLLQLPSLCQRREINRKQGLQAILAWEQSTMSRFQHERKRRLERLSALDQGAIGGEEGQEATGGLGTGENCP